MLIPEVIWGEKVDQVFEQNRVVVLVFYSQDCGPCNQMKENVLPRIMEKFAHKRDYSFCMIFTHQFGGRLANQNIADRFGVDGGHPVVIVFEWGVEIGRDECWTNQYGSMMDLLKKVSYGYDRARTKLSMCA